MEKKDTLFPKLITKIPGWWVTKMMRSCSLEHYNGTALTTPVLDSSTEVRASSMRARTSVPHPIRLSGAGKHAPRKEHFLECRINLK